MTIRAQAIAISAVLLLITFPTIQAINYSGSAIPRVSDPIGITIPKNSPKTQTTTKKVVIPSSNNSTQNTQNSTQTEEVIQIYPTQSELVQLTLTPTPTPLSITSTIESTPTPPETSTLDEKDDEATSNTEEDTEDSFAKEVRGIGKIVSQLVRNKDD
jgi:hypothetical protein